MDYEKYLNDCRELWHKPTMTAKQFKEMEDEDEVLAKIRPKAGARPIEATFMHKLKEEGE